MVIETDRLILRKMTPDDFDALYAVLADSDIMQHYPWAFDENQVRGWMLINGQIKPEIGYHIRKDCQRKGYGSEAAKAVRDWSFENTPFNVIYSYMKYTNIASCATAVANGMRQVDEFEDEVNTITKVYAINRDEWKKRQR